jgi:hypothetical protein
MICKVCFQQLQKVRFTWLGRRHITDEFESCFCITPKKE